MALKRAEHWATRAFYEFLLSRAHTPFVWGKTDCALFCADGIKAITGVDIASDFRGSMYIDEASAMQTIKAVTGTGSRSPMPPHTARSNMACQNGRIRCSRAAATWWCSRMRDA